jgi:hypothetical protein
MELLLNIAWLMLTIPAIWIWVHTPARQKGARLLRGLGAIVLLGCVLVLLFPVVSASDDLHAMRPDIEESSPGKRIVRQAPAHASHVPPVISGNFVLAAGLRFSLARIGEAIISSTFVQPFSHTGLSVRERAPPVLFA